MTTGLPDWRKASVLHPITYSYIWGYSGRGTATQTKYDVVITISNNIKENLKGKLVRVYSFSANGYITWTRDATHTQTYCGQPTYRLLFFDIPGNLVGGVTELQSPIIIDNVDVIRANILLPLDRVADSTNPSKYSYNAVFHASYQIM